MTTQYVMKATHINTEPFGIVHWVVTGAPDNTGAQSGYNVADLTNISVDYVSTHSVATTTGSLGISVSGTPAPGAVLRAISDSASAWGQLDLNDTDAITGVLPDSNQGAQTLSGDVSGTTSAVSVNKIKGNPISSLSLGSSQDGYVLTWSNSDGYWKPQVTQVIRASVTSITTNYSVIATDKYISVGILSAPIAVTLPVSPTTGDIYTIKDANGSASTNNITINGNGANIDSAATSLINVDYMSVTLLYNGSKWIIV